WNDDGLSSKLTERAGVRWSIDSVTGNARRNVPRSSNREVQTCAACHSRRVQVADRAASGHTLLDRYLPSLILPGLYYADGQQRDEVYDYGSFLQSRMYHAGVTCSDCHNPHTGSVRSSGNALCAQCHRPEKYDTIAHTFHARGSPGSSCISCHMPSRIYMQVDARQDHSIRIPRPDQSQRYGTPNACNLCHTNRDAAWASGQVLRWYGHQASGYQRFADAFAADERQDTSAGRALTSLATDRTQPSIVRASALARLALRPASIPPATLQRLAMDSSALVRYGALLTLESFPPASRVAAAAPLLADSVRAVRIQAAWVLAPVAGELTGDAAAHFTTAASDFIESQRYNGDRAENRLTLGTFLAELGRFDEATAAFSGAIALSPDLAEAYANLADVERGQGQEKKSESTLRLGITKSPADPRLHYALGLALARQQRLADAVASLATADSLAPNDASIGYGYALALHSAGEDRKARSVAMRVLASAPGDSRVRELLRELK
ncbi:MAG TPA: tetratricopeptide repeat protein, partial [Gemmatimonadaceae bacterium]|nr:tetratricopeptide repeat protein [Gemmatimonadaceae bacterium]